MKYTNTPYGDYYSPKSDVKLAVDYVQDTNPIGIDRFANYY